MRRRPFLAAAQATRIFLVAVLVACRVCCGCATPQQEVYAVGPTSSWRGVIFAIEGAGGWEATSTALRQTIAEQRLPYYVETFDWSHGRGRFFADQVDVGYARDEGRCLAERITAYRQNCPCAQVFVVAHSAGSLAYVWECAP